MKRTYILIPLFCLWGAAQASANLVTSYTALANLSSTVAASTTTVTVASGDVVVMVAGSNKKVSASPISFSTTGAGSFINLNASTVLTSDPNPDAYLSYYEVTTGGTYDFTASVVGTVTANIGLYHISATSGTIAILDNDAQEYSGFNTGESLSLTNSLSWVGNPAYGDVAVIGAISSLKGNASTSTMTVDFNGSDRRLYGDIALVSGTTSFENIWDITASDVNESGSAVALALAESVVVPEPSTLALFFSALLGLAVCRRKLFQKT